ncbi:MAG: dephospho-CoA kinase [SAR202 cluster bacterium]|nr:dephospho-CoA kinase [SAR202 cluster bacterium]
MLVIGLTGGIGTGKSAVARILQGLGAEIIDADRVGHEAYLPGTSGWRDVTAAFGKDILTPSGEVDRKKLGAVVFGDPKALERLNRILHPRMYSMMETRLKALRERDCKVAVVEAALLIEANWTPLADTVWVVTASDDVVMERLRARSQTDEASLKARIHAQMPQSERLKHADAVIENNGSPAELEQRVKSLWNARVT